MSNLLDDIAAALGALGGRGAFATELTAPSKHLQLSVQGVGPIRFPISPATARKLCAVARPAPFGHETKTLLDRRVRDTWEIAVDQLEADAAKWTSALGAHLVTIGRRLGLPDDGDLEAVPDKMLIYGPGQFFVQHQDSERADEMVASLVVVLPSTHAGGAVVVEHQGKTVTLRGAAGRTEIALLAFYADCRHRVAPVTSGYRVVLTYHLLYRGAAVAAAPTAASSEALARSVTAYFSTPVARRWSNRPPERPERLVYFLDHEYSQKSLGWDRLKGSDRQRVAALRAVAEQSGYEVFLALADVHENWTCEEEDWGGRGRGRRFGSRDADDEVGADDHQLVDLNDTEIALTSWIRADGRAARGMAAKAEIAEVCATRSSSDMRPVRSEYEGYMGNYGNTVDRWYHRAALVMWPRDRAFSVRAKLSPAWAVKEIDKRIRASKLDDARQAACDLAPFWATSIRASEPTEAFVRDLVLVATALDDPGVALPLLAPLGPHRITPGVGPALAAAVMGYPLTWSQELFTTWSQHHRHDTPPWLPMFAGLCGELVAAGDRGRELATWLLLRESASLEERHKDIRQTPVAFAERAVDVHLDDLLALVEAAAALGASQVRDHLLSLLVAPSTRLPLSASGAFFQKVAAGRTASAIRELGLGALHTELVALLEQALAAPPRSPDDWSVAPPSKCKCALCVELSSFLRDRRVVRHDWPLAKDGRRHVHGQIDSYGLPVSHTTQRIGSPHTLVFVKQRTLFTRAEAERANWAALVAWLKKHREAFCQPKKRGTSQRRRVP